MSRPSIRWRGRKSTSSSAPPNPRRCSSVSSTTSLDSSSSGGEKDDCIDLVNSIIRPSFSFFRNLLIFDSINLQSTTWRNQSMLTSMNASSSPEKYVSHFGVDVLFLPHRFHYYSKELEPYRKIGDPEIDAILHHLSMNNIETDDDDDDDDDNDGCGCGAFDDVVAYAERQYEKNGGGNIGDYPVVQFYKHYYEHIPPWVDFEQIQRGIDVFLAYLPVAGCALFYRSLVGGFSIPQIVEVLRASRYLVPSHLTSMIGHRSSVRTVEAINRDRKLAEERLFDTGGFLACCFAPQESPADSLLVLPSAASLRPGGPGWKAALRVRVLHAKVRRSLLQSKKSGGDGQSILRWDIEKNGIPINQEDMAATLLAFSVNVLVGIEIISGEPLDLSEQRDYLALWRYLGWLLGVNTPENVSRDGQPISSNAYENQRLPPIDPCGPTKQTFDQTIDISRSDTHNDSILHAYATLESMILHLLHPVQSSRELVAHLLNLRSSYTFRSEVCRKLLSELLSDELGIPKSCIQWKGWKIESVSNFVRHMSLKFFLFSFLLSLRIYTRFTKKFPWARRRAIIRHGYLERKFLFVWEKSHKQRVTKAASKNGKSATVSSTENKSFCPFSMIMSPKLGTYSEQVMQ